MSKVAELAKQIQEFKQSIDRTVGKLNDQIAKYKKKLDELQKTVNRAKKAVQFEIDKIKRKIEDKIKAINDWLAAMMKRLNDFISKWTKKLMLNELRLLATAALAILGALGLVKSFNDQLADMVSKGAKEQRIDTTSIYRDVYSDYIGNLVTDDHGAIKELITNTELVDSIIVSNSTPDVPEPDTSNTPKTPKLYTNKTIEEILETGKADTIGSIYTNVGVDEIIETGKADTIGSIYNDSGVVEEDGFDIDEYIKSHPIRSYRVP